MIDKEKTEVEKLQERLAAKEKELQEWHDKFDSRIDQFRRKEYYRPHNLYSGIIKESVLFQFFIPVVECQYMRLFGGVFRGKA